MQTIISIKVLFVVLIFLTSCSVSSNHNESNSDFTSPINGVIRSEDGISSGFRQGESSSGLQSVTPIIRSYWGQE